MLSETKLEWQRRSRAVKRAKRLCVDCGIHSAVMLCWDKKLRCVNCSRKRRIRLQYKKRRDRGVCMECLRPCDKFRCLECYEKHKMRNQTYQQKNRKKAIEFLGGKCVDCGLVSDFSAVYDIHHVDPLLKSLTINKVTRRRWEAILAEIQKCVLLCANCHRIRHAKGEL